jgi:alcohol dehydrogenase class IV
MMQPFEFFSVPQIVFGRGSFQRVGEIIAARGRVAMIVSNAGEPGDGRLVDRLIENLTRAGVAWRFWKQSGEPQVAHIEQALAVARQGECDCVIGIGGGSAIDAAKAVAALIANGGSPLDYMEVIGKGEKIRKPAAPWIAVPTTAGTGAEATRNAVIGCPEKRFKASLRSPYLIAHVAIVDAELSADVPREVVACSGMDALCQLIESYTSNQANVFSDPLAIQGIQLASRSLLRAWQDPSDLEARDDMALAALLSGITLTNAGLGAVHGFAAPMGAYLPIPHGTICAALLPHVIAANVDALCVVDPDHIALMKYATVGRLVSDAMDLPFSVAVENAIHFVADLAEQMGIPRLGPFGLTHDNALEIAALARKASSMRYNPVVLDEQVLVQILEKAM